METDVGTVILTIAPTGNGKGMNIVKSNCYYSLISPVADLIVTFDESMMAGVLILYLMSTICPSMKLPSRL